jgi:hypothetical protein
MLVSENRKRNRVDEMQNFLILRRCNLSSCILQKLLNTWIFQTNNHVNRTFNDKFSKLWCLTLSWVRRFHFTSSKLIRQMKISFDIIFPHISESYKEPACPFFRLKLNPSERACQNIERQLPPQKTIFCFRDKFYVGQTDRFPTRVSEI